MKAVLLFGSPHTGGFTAGFAEKYIARRCDGYDVARFSAYEMLVRPCAGCGGCAGGAGCVYRDMDELLTAIAGAELLIIASPVYYLSFPAPLKAVIDRLQPLYEAQGAGVGDMRDIRRRVAVLLTAGRPGERGETVARQLRWVMQPLNADMDELLVIPGTDSLTPESFGEKVDMLLDRL